MTLTLRLFEGTLLRGLIPVILWGFIVHVYEIGLWHVEALGDWNVGTIPLRHPDLVKVYTPSRHDIHLYVHVTRIPYGSH